MDPAVLYNLQPEEVETLENVKHNIKMECNYYQCNEYKLIRFMRAKKFDMRRTMRGLKQDIEWRKAGNIDHLAETYASPPVLKGFFPIYILGMDREGSPIMVLELGTTDMNGLMKCVSVDLITKHITYILEVGERYMDSHLEDLQDNPAKQQWFIVIDCKDFSALFATNRSFHTFARNLADEYGKHYPERVKSVLIINATPPFQSFYKGFVQFLTPATVEKVQVFEDAGWQEKIREYIDPSVLPQYLGGDVEVKDVTKFKSITPIVRGGPIPKKFFSTTEGSLKTQLGIAEYTLKRSETFKVPVRVAKPNSVLRWEFETECHSIGFGLEYSPSHEAEPTVIIPIQRIYVDNFTETGEYLCQEAGIYTLTFDNSFSWVTSKVLYFRHSVWDA